jgi:hypothetical protein
MAEEGNDLGRDQGRIILKHVEGRISDTGRVAHKIDAPS